MTEPAGQVVIIDNPTITVAEAAAIAAAWADLVEHLRAGTR